MKNSILRLVVVGATSTSLASTASSQQAVQWRAEDGGNGHWYGLYIQPAVSWDQADQIARTRNGHLCTITSLAESTWVWQNLASNPGAWRTDINFAGPHIGGTCDAGGQWSWVTGEPWVFVNAGSCFNAGLTGEGRLHFGCSALENRWNDIAAGDLNSGGFIVEWSADCNDDGIVDYGQCIDGSLLDANLNHVPDQCECAVDPTLQACCPCDAFRDGFVNGIDLGMLLSQWGEVTKSTVTDFNRDGAVDGADLGQLLAAWGPCPS